MDLESLADAPYKQVVPEEAQSREGSQRRDASKRDDYNDRDRHSRDDSDRRRDSSSRDHRSRDRRDDRRDHNGHGRRRSRSPRREDTHERPASASDRQEKPAQISEEERDQRTVFVQQLAARLRTKELIKFFEAAGPVRDAQIVKDRVSGRSKGSVVARSIYYCKAMLMMCQGRLC